MMQMLELASQIHLPLDPNKVAVPLVGAFAAAQEIAATDPQSTPGRHPRVQELSGSSARSSNRSGSSKAPSTPAVDLFTAAVMFSRPGADNTVTHQLVADAAGLDRDDDILSSNPSISAAIDAVTATFANDDADDEMMEILAAGRAASSHPNVQALLGSMQDWSPFFQPIVDDLAPILAQAPIRIPRGPLRIDQRRPESLRPPSYEGSESDRSLGSPSRTKSALPDARQVSPQSWSSPGRRAPSPSARASSPSARAPSPSARSPSLRPGAISPASFRAEATSGRDLTSDGGVAFAYPPSASSSASESDRPPSSNRLSPRQSLASSGRRQSFASSARPQSLASSARPQSKKSDQSEGKTEFIANASPEERVGMMRNLLRTMNVSRTTQLVGIVVIFCALLWMGVGTNMLPFFTRLVGMMNAAGPGPVAETVAQAVQQEFANTGPIGWTHQLALPAPEAAAIAPDMQLVAVPDVPAAVGPDALVPVDPGAVQDAFMRDMNQPPGNGPPNEICFPDMSSMLWATLCALMSSLGAFLFYALCIAICLCKCCMKTSYRGGRLAYRGAKWAAKSKGPKIPNLPVLANAKIEGTRVMWNGYEISKIKKVRADGALDKCLGVKKANVFGISARCNGAVSADAPGPEKFCKFHRGGRNDQSFLYGQFDDDDE